MNAIWHSPGLGILVITTSIDIPSLRDSRDVCNSFFYKHSVPTGLKNGLIDERYPYKPLLLLNDWLLKVI